MYNNSIFITKAKFLVFSMYIPGHLCINSCSFNKGVIIVNRKTEHKIKKTKLKQNQMKHRHITGFGLLSIHGSEAYKMESFLL